MGDAGNDEVRMSVEQELIAKLGPLAPLVGVWEGDKGDDVSPDEALGAEKNRYREKITFELLSEVRNHQQSLFGLRYATVATRIGEESAFHEELGYWLWDPAARQVLRCFMVPRGVTILAGGSAAPDARTFRLAADAGSDTYGICSNRFLDEEFKTVRYELEVTVHGPDSFSYSEDIQLRLKGRTELFHHTDSNTLHKVG